MRDRIRPPLGWLLVTAVLGLGLAPVAAAAEQSKGVRNPYRLTPAEQARVSELAQSALGEYEISTAERVHLVATRVARDKEAADGGERGRVAVATFYRYEGDQTIFVRVDLASGEVVGVESATAVPTPLSKEEFEEAKRLALAEPRIAGALEEYPGVEIEPLVVRTIAEDDPLFGHRALRLLFKTDRGYLRRPIVVVDLTARRVLIEKPPAEKAPVYPGTGRGRKGGRS